MTGMTASRDARGDEFTSLLAQSERQLFAYVLALVWNAQDAEDLYQQTAMLMWEKFDEFERGTDFARWAFAFAKHVVFNYQRRQQRRKTFLTAELAATLADRQAAAEEPLAYGDALQDCMNQLGDADRRLIHLCYDGRQSIKQIAAALGRPAQSTYNSLCRIRRRLFECVRRAAARRSDP
jgi:RNA polymerase sigma-70 factor (ECF subfamily)